jgi:type IV pilus assembly protein PilE
MRDEMKQFRLSRGFTLIEIMIVVTVLALLAAIAYPSYDEAVRRGRRSDAQSGVLMSAQFMERYFTTNATYVGATLPTSLQTSPEAASATRKFYDIQLSNIAANTYTLTAVRSASRPQSTDKCGDFSVDQTGSKSLVNNTATVDQCWRR